jgi:RND family efflux transporter MFP subunit
MRTRTIAAVSAAIVVLAVVLAVVTRGGQPLSITTAAATEGPVARQVLAAGTLEPVRMVEVSVQVSGTVAELPVDFNSVVKAGQIIAKLDPSVYQSQLEAARGQLAQAKAEASQAQTTLDDANAKLGRAKELASQQLIAQSELDDARIVMEQAAADLRGRQAAIKSAEASVKQAEVDLSRTVVRAPIDGIVVNRAVDVGQTVAATFQSPTLFTIADVRTMNLLTEVNESEIGAVRKGSDVSFQVESAGPETFHGKVTDVRLQPYADQAGAMVAVSTTGTGATTGTAGTSGTSGTSGGANGSSTAAGTTNTTGASGNSSSTVATPGAVTYTAVVGVDNPDGKLAPGGTAIVTLAGATKSRVIRLPNTALSFRPSPAVLERIGQKDVPPNGAAAAGEGPTRVTQVWRFENHRFVPLDVVTGLSDDQWTEMINGPVQPGDALVTSAAPEQK